MKKAVLLIMSVLLLMTSSGCISVKKGISANSQTKTNEDIEALKKENIELKNRNQQLENKNKNTEAEIAALKKENEKLKNNTQNTDDANYEKYIINERNSYLKKEVRLLRKELSGSGKIADMKNIFNPCSLEAKDKVGKLSVRSVSITDAENVNFEGPFEATGDIIINEAGGDNDALAFMTKKSSDGLPVSIRQLDYDSIYFTIINSKDLIPLLGDKYKNNPDFKLNITAQFSGYDYWYKEGTDVSSKAKFIKLISINK